MTFTLLGRTLVARARRTGAVCSLSSLVLIGLTTVSPTASAAGDRTAAPGDRSAHTTPSPRCPSLLDHRFPDLTTGASQSMCAFAGKVVLVVNTASHCGYTPQYKGLEALYRRYRERGLVIVGFPSNDFGSQEPGNSKDIAEFCEVNYGVSFPMVDKTVVSGPGANPFHASLARKTGSSPAWNFHKYLIDRRGEAVRSYASAVEPSDARLRQEIERLLDN